MNSFEFACLIFGAFGLLCLANWSMRDFFDGGR